MALERSIPRLSSRASLFLDVVRALSAELVVVGHGASFFFATERPAHAAVFQWVTIQDVSVLVFFLLSGFLISLSVLSKLERTAGAYSFREYFIDRFARIYSGYIPALIFIAAVDWFQSTKHAGEFAHHSAYDVRNLVANLLMLQNYPPGDFLVGRFNRTLGELWPSPFGSGRPLWSLAIEWWLYLTFGWIVLARGLRHTSPRRFWLVLAFFLVIPIWNVVVRNGIPLIWVEGMVASFLFARTVGATNGSIDKRTCYGVAVGLLVVGIVRSTQLHGNAYDLVLATLLGGALFLVTLGLQQSDAPASAAATKSVRLVADYSFTLYLVHYSVLEVFTLARGRYSPLVLLAASFAVSNLIAFALASFTEMRHQRLNAYLKRAVVSDRVAVRSA